SVLATDGVVWLDQQRTALDAIAAWLKNGNIEPYYLAGHAGTGKTTLAKEIGRRAGDVVFGAYTGKAAGFTYLHTAAGSSVRRHSAVRPHPSLSGRKPLPASARALHRPDSQRAKHGRRRRPRRDR